MKESESVDLFMKVDADMVLCRNTFFREIVEYFTRHSEIDHYATYVHDFFTDRLIGALHTFRNTVRWATSSDTIFVDRNQINQKSITDKNDLAPAAYHCPNPSKFQAFHFGLHKAVKAIQFMKEEKKYGSACEHWENYELTKKHCYNSDNEVLAYAVLGAEIAFREKYTAIEVNYDNKDIREVFKKYESLKIQDIKRETERFSLRGWSFFPPKLRHDVLFRTKTRKLFSLTNLPLYRYILRMIYYHTKMKIIEGLK